MTQEQQPFQNKIEGHNSYKQPPLQNKIEGHNSYKYTKQVRSEDRRG